MRPLYNLYHNQFLSMLILHTTPVAVKLFYRERDIMSDFLTCDI